SNGPVSYITAPDNISRPSITSTNSGILLVLIDLFESCMDTGITKVSIKVLEISCLEPSLQVLSNCRPLTAVGAPLFPSSPQYRQRLLAHHLCFSSSERVLALVESICIGSGVKLDLL
ncbi:14715_t:CDS:2, partial [Racocetra persica]